MSKLSLKYASQTSSTEGDSCSDRQQEICVHAPVLRTNPLKHKTELCKTYSELGYCNYGDKCRFAHGRNELIHGCQGKGKLHKDRKCKGFWKNGICPYGIRCQFGHGENDWTTNSCLSGMVAVVNPEELPKQSRLLRLL